MADLKAELPVITGLPRCEFVGCKQAAVYKNFIELHAQPGDEPIYWGMPLWLCPIHQDSLDPTQIFNANGWEQLCTSVFLNNHRVPRLELTKFRRVIVTWVN